MALMLFQKWNSQLYFPVLQVGLRGKYRETDRRRDETTQHVIQQNTIGMIERISKHTTLKEGDSEEILRKKRGEVNGL